MASPWSQAKRSLKSKILGHGQGRAPARLACNFRTPDASGIDLIVSSLLQNYFTRAMESIDRTPDEYLATNEGQTDLKDHVAGRLERFRNTAIPWLDAARTLAGASILEIGCGTGSSTVALAEQGAKVTAVDIDAPSLAVARDRCAVYGINAEFHCANAVDVRSIFQDRTFDFVIFFACLEHMIHKERIEAMKSTWDMLMPGQLWCVIETPNRLWHFDGHTALMPFYLWLPDDLALKYSKLSPRRPFNSLHSDTSQEAMLRFQREGRGVSFHEFDLTMGSTEKLEVVSSLPIYLRKQTPLWEIGRRLTGSPNYRFECLLRELGPAIHAGFYQSSLDLIIRKR